MKKKIFKIFMLTTTLLTLTFFTACSSDDDDDLSVPEVSAPSSSIQSLLGKYRGTLTIGSTKYYSEKSIKIAQ